MWERLTLEERWRLLGIYVGSVGLAAILAFGWGRSVGIRATSGEAPPATNTQVFDLNSDKTTPLETPSQTTDKSETSTPDTVTVHVAGRVKKPGVYTLPRDQRVQDAIQQAGGALPDADLESLNLAAHLEDGDKIRVLRKGEVVAANDPDHLSDKTGSSSERKSGQTEPVIVNINQASAEELGRLPGIGEVLAQRIIELRKQRGRFESVDELLDIDGIGPRKLEKMRPYLRLK